MHTPCPAGRFFCMVCRELGAKIKSIYVNGHCMSNFSYSTLLASPLCLCQNMGLLERGTKVNDLFDGLSIITTIREIPKLFLTSIETVSWTICFFSLPDAAICQFPVKKMGFCKKPPKVFFFPLFLFLICNRESTKIRLKTYFAASTK